ncbi:hypothetical protein NFJ02_35g87820 [Pycnococcus provasolii]
MIARKCKSHVAITIPTTKRIIMASARPLRLAVLKKWRRSVLTDCGAAGVDAYVQDEYETLLKSLPILVYGLLKARIFKVNWYEVLGLELLAVVRRIGRDAKQIAEDIKACVKRDGGNLDDAINVHNSLEPMLKELKAPEAAVRRLTEEISSCRRSETAAARAEAEGLRRDISTAKRALNEAREAHRNDVEKLKRERDMLQARLDDEVGGAAGELDDVREERDMLKVEVTKLRLAAQKAEEEAAQAQRDNKILAVRLATAEREMQRMIGLTTVKRWSNAPREPHRKLALERELDIKLTRGAGPGVAVKRVALKGRTANSLQGLALEEMAVVASERHIGRLYMFGGGFKSDTGTEPGKLGAGDLEIGDNTLGMRAFVVDIATGMVDEMVSIGDVPTPRIHASAIVLSDGSDSRTMAGFDERASAHVLTLPVDDNGRETVLVFGGEDVHGWRNDAFLFDPDARMWHRLADGAAFGGRVLATTSPARQRNAATVLSRDWEGMGESGGEAQVVEGALSPLDRVSAFTVSSKSPGDPRVAAFRKKLSELQADRDNALQIARKHESILSRMRQGSVSAMVSVPNISTRAEVAAPQSARGYASRVGKSETMTTAAVHDDHRSSHIPVVTHPRRAFTPPPRRTSGNFDDADVRTPPPSEPPPFPRAIVSSITTVKKPDRPPSRIIRRGPHVVGQTPPPLLTPRKEEAVMSRALPSMPAVAPARWRNGREDKRDDPAARYYSGSAGALFAAMASCERPLTSLSHFDVPADMALRLTNLYRGSTGASFDAHASAMGLDAATIYELASARARSVSPPTSPLLSPQHHEKSRPQSRGSTTDM